MMGPVLVCASVSASLFFVHVAVLPLVFKYSKYIQRKIVFSNCINYPRHPDYDNPSSCDVTGGKNFSVEFQSLEDRCPIKLGAWHIVPCSVCRRNQFAVKDAKIMEQCLQEDLKHTDRPVVLYCHGNSNHRGSPHRLQMYKVFQELNFHVITFDYRGYGDSTRIRPTEAGVVEDALYMYAWLLEKLNPTQRPKVIIWGHSLGTAVASNLLANLETLCKRYNMKSLPPPDALILEAAFNNLCEEIQCHPVSKLVSWLPYFENTFIKPFSASPEYAFNTDQYLSVVTEIPLLLLHSRGDQIVPYKLAVKLHTSVMKSRLDGGAPVIMHPFDRGQGLGHNNMCEARDLPTVIQSFLGVIDNHKSFKCSTSSL